jgi:hypothetical protein
MIVKFLNFTMLCFLSVSFSASALEIPLQSGDRLVVSVTEGLWTLRSLPSRGPQNARIEGIEAESNFQVERKSGLVEVRSRDQLNKLDFGKVSGKKREYELSLPIGTTVDFHLLEGSLTASRLTKEGLLHVQKGKMILKELSGSWNLQMQKGEMSVQDSQGRLMMDSYGARLEVKNFNGDSEISNFTGDTHLEKLKGFCSITQGAGAAKILASSGTMQFELSKGSIQVQQFAGRIEGQSQDGTLSVSLAKDGELNARTQNGKISVVTPAGSGTLVNVATQEGELVGPDSLRVAKDSGAKSLRGRTAGPAGKASVYIRAQEGSIVVR